MVKTKWRRKVSNNNKTMELSRFVYLKKYEFIPEGSVIHHIDGNELNNDIENLKCLSVSEHHKIHAQGIGKNRKLTRNWKENISNGLLKYYSKNNVWNKGIPTMTDSNKQKLKQSQHKKDYCAIGKKISSSKRGHFVSIETKQKISDTLKNRKKLKLRSSNLKELKA